ncbi:ASCH domain-containing protein [Paucilactobacillus kaifaensis]|uniref:ASCH domain-containing protein n=1 Tax=Paucilactobacillus kaifaensis TaxID=2559921 RepID=UPI0010F87241|nr:ASCH domain-containing protein [Paucilactobacillus kaifaensis]
MKALSIKNPYAEQILLGNKTIEYRSWTPPQQIKQFLLVSSGTPSDTEFGLYFAHGYALAIVNIDRVSAKQNSDGNYQWHVSTAVPVEPFQVKGKLHFYDVDDDLIKPRTDLLESMTAFAAGEEATAGDLFVDEYYKPLVEIAAKQLPKKYSKILNDNHGDWSPVIDAWMDD